MVTWSRPLGQPTEPWPNQPTVITGDTVYMRLVTLNGPTSATTTRNVTLDELLVKSSSKPSGKLADGGLLIGRRSSGALSDVFNARVLSRNHAQFLVDCKGHVCVIDLGSMHGTTLERGSGRMMPWFISTTSATQVSDGDVLVFGKAIDVRGIMHEPVRVRVQLRYAASNGAGRVSVTDFAGVKDVAAINVSINGEASLATEPSATPTISVTPATEEAPRRNSYGLNPSVVYESEPEEEFPRGPPCEGFAQPIPAPATQFDGVVVIDDDTSSEQEVQFVKATQDAAGSQQSPIVLDGETPEADEQVPNVTIVNVTFNGEPVAVQEVTGLSLFGDYADDSDVSSRGSVVDEHDRQDDNASAQSDDEMASNAGSDGNDSEGHESVTYNFADMFGLAVQSEDESALSNSDIENDHSEGDAQVFESGEEDVGEDGFGDDASGLSDAASAVDEGDIGYPRDSLAGLFGSEDEDGDNFFYANGYPDVEEGNESESESEHDGGTKYLDDDDSEDESYREGGSELDDDAADDVSEDDASEEEDEEQHINSTDLHRPFIWCAEAGCTCSLPSLPRLPMSLESTSTRVFTPMMSPPHSTENSPQREDIQLESLSTPSARPPTVIGLATPPSPQAVLKVSVDTSEQDVEPVSIPALSPARGSKRKHDEVVELTESDSRKKHEADPTSLEHARGTDLAAIMTQAAAELTDKATNTAAEPPVAPAAPTAPTERPPKRRRISHGLGYVRRCIRTAAPKVGLVALGVVLGSAGTISALLTFADE